MSESIILDDGLCQRVIEVSAVKGGLCSISYFRVEGRPGQQLSPCWWSSVARGVCRYAL
jgi:hypothetical protein